MEKGNEGDEIIFLSLRQIECPIPDSVVKVGQITADLLVEILARSLLLISEGEIKFPVTLPPNIASRHRICTSIASKIKELGFLSDCGYNQLLYPVESQTRDLLKWLVQKLPRSEEEGAQEVLGANALMNRRIMQSLKEWKQTPWKLQFCSKGKVLRNVYDSKPFRTIPGLLEKQHKGDADRTTLSVFQSAAVRKMAVEASIFERHALELVADSTYALRLERDFDASGAAGAEGEELEGVEGGGASGESKQAGAGGKGSKGAMQKAVQAALLRAVQGDIAAASAAAVASGRAGGAGDAGGAGGADGVSILANHDKATQAKQLNSTLQDLMQSITEDYQSAIGSKHVSSASDRGTRFSHAIEFGQEESATVAIASCIAGVTDPAGRSAGAPSSSSSSGKTGSGAGGAAGSAGGAGTGGGGGGGEAGDESADGTSGGAGAGAGGWNDSTGTGASSGSAGAGAGGASRQANLPRRSQQELEELARQEELESLRNEVQQYTNTVETIIRNQASAGARTKQFENDLTNVVAETEKMEREVLMKKKTLEMLPTARDHIAQLQEVASAGTQRLLGLAQEWDRHRIPLVDQLREREELQSKRREKGRQMVEEAKRYRLEMAAMIQDLKDRQDRLQMLNEEKSKLNKNINRAMYTHRIMDITSQIVKQNKDIDKITADIRDIQKTINLNSSTLQRADAITEELIFSAATDKNDPVMVDTYRRLKTLRSKFEELIGTVGKIGQQEKANRDLETKIDQEQSRISSNNFDRIKQDLDAIVKENAQLVGQIKAVSAKQHK